MLWLFYKIYQLLLKSTKTRHIGDEGIHGTLAPFDLSKESWSHYVERLGFYFVANDVEGDDKKRSILLSICGHQTFKLIISLLDAQALETKTYDDLVKMVKDYIL